jgi:hypothetical protein
MKTKEGGKSVTLENKEFHFSNIVKDAVSRMMKEKGVSHEVAVAAVNKIVGDENFKKHFSDVIYFKAAANLS